jgi:hypothetical protein
MQPKKSPAAIKITPSPFKYKSGIPRSSKKQPKPEYLPAFTFSMSVPLQRGQIISAISYSC